MALGNNPTQLEVVKAIKDLENAPAQATDVQVNGTSITSGGVANIVTESAYNASTNKIATKNDITKANIGLSNVANERQYSANNPPPAPTNMVTTDTAQTISGQKTFTSNIITDGHITTKNTSYAYTDNPTSASGKHLYFADKNGALVSDVYSGIGNGWNSLNFYVRNKSNEGRQIEFCHDANNNEWRFDCTTDNSMDLGIASRRWRNGYFGSGVYDYGSIAVRGVDAKANYTGYFLIAYAENVPTYQPATAKIIAEDFDTVGSCYEIDVNVYFGFDNTNNVKTYSPRVRAISSTGSDPVAFSKNNILVVMRTTNSTSSSGTNRVEIWYRGTATYSRFKFTFLYDAGQVRTDSIVKWTKVTSTSSVDAGYVSAGNIVYLDSSNQFPTFIPTASWSTNAFITSQYVAANISANSMSNIMCASLFRAFATTPNIEGYMAGDDYNKSPSATQSAQFLARDKNGQWMGGMRVYHNTDGTIQAQLMCRSQNTANQGYVCLESASNSNPITTAGVFRFIPNVNESFDLGTSSKKWRNIYGVNVYATSDRRLKENIKDAELDCGAVIDELPIKEFNFKSDEEKKVVVGAIAQELQEILPEKYRATLVSGSEDTSYSINEGKLLYVAIGALKEERAKTKELEERLARLEAKLGV